MNEIKTKRFLLRKININDSNDVFNILNDKETTKYLNMSEIEQISDAQALITDYLIKNDKGEKYPFAIIDLVDSHFVGVFLIKLDLFDDDCFEFTVYIKKDYWNQGIYSEVLPYMVDFAFDTIKTGNFRGFVMKSNIASSKVLLKSGFVHEKTFTVDGLPEQIESYLMTKNDYINLQKKQIP